MKRTAELLGITACFAMLSAILAGCVVIPLPEHDLIWGRGKINDEHLDSLVMGKTTREEVLLRLGEPDAVLDNATYLVYDWAVAVGMVGTYGGAGPLTQEKYLIFEFNQDNTLRRLIRGEGLSGTRKKIREIRNLIKKDPG